MTDGDVFSGFGLGLRPEHYQSILAEKPAVDWFEILTEDFLVAGGGPLYYLDKIRAQYPVAMHGVSLSIGSCDSLNWDYLKQLKLLVDRVQPIWVSDHLCWTGIDSLNTHDLLPLPHTEEAIKHVVDRVERVQDYLQRQISLENVSRYIAYKHSVIPEWEFLAEVAKRADCLILLDINNIYVNAFNYGFNPEHYLAGIPKERVRQFHMAGHKHCHTHIIDTHDSSIVDAVWELYANALNYFAPVATLIERDGDIPPIHELVAELKKARQVYQETIPERVK